jgi:hypothetical protein
VRILESCILAKRSKPRKAKSKPRKAKSKPRKPSRRYPSDTDSESDESQTEFATFARLKPRKSTRPEEESRVVADLADNTTQLWSVSPTTSEEEPLAVTALVGDTQSWDKS